MSYQDELIELLSSEDNIATTLEISEAVGRVKARLQRQFWNAVAERIKDGLAEEGRHEEWRIDGLEDALANPAKNDVGIGLARRPAGDGARLVFGVWQEGRLCHSVGFDKEQPDPHPLREIQELQAAMAKKLPGEPDKWNLAWAWTDIDLNDQSSLIDIASDPSSLADKAVQPILDILEKYGAEIAKADTALARAQAL